MWVDRLLRRLTLPAVVVIAVLVALGAASFFAYQDGALGRSQVACDSIAADLFGPTDPKPFFTTATPTAENPSALPRPVKGAEAHNREVACTKSARGQIPKLILYSLLIGLAVAVGLAFVARGFSPTPPRATAGLEPTSQPPLDNLSDELERLGDLRTQGLLTDEEFSQAKAAAIHRARS